jgi:hypothetical protein
MAIGDIKTFDYVYSGLTLQINAIDMGDGTVRFEIVCVSGSADINALYWSDGVADGNNFDLGTKKDNSLNMNGSGEDWDGGVKLSSAGIGPEGDAKPTYLQTGESYVMDASLDWDTLDTLGVRATSTSTAGGSIKGVDGEPDVTECPHMSINDVTVAEEAGNAVFTVSLAEAYLYDVTISYTTADGSADSSDYTTTSGTITILAGQTSATITVPILDDNNPEPSETFVVNLTGATADIPDLAGGSDSVISVEHCIVDGQGVGTITDTDDDTPPPVDTVNAVDDDPACGVEGQYKVQLDTNGDGVVNDDNKDDIPDDEATYVDGTGVPIAGNVLDNDTDSLGHGLHITHINGVALVDLDATPVGSVYEFAITDGILKIDADTGDFEFTYTGPNLPVGAPDWEGSFTYTVTDGNDENDSDDSVHTATVDLCIDAAGASHGYWMNHDFSGSEGFAGAVGTTTFDDFFHLDDGAVLNDQAAPRTWTDKVGPNTEFFADDLSFSQAVTFGNGNLTGDFTVPDVAGTTAEADLVREAATAVLNYYDADSSDAFVTAYIYQRNLDDNDGDPLNNPTDSATALADLQAQVQATFDGAAGAYTVDELAALLHATHE